MLLAGMRLRTCVRVCVCICTLMYVNACMHVYTCLSLSVYTPIDILWRFICVRLSYPRKIAGGGWRAPKLRWGSEGRICIECFIRAVAVIGYYLFILYLFLPYYSIGCFFFQRPDTGATCVKFFWHKGEVIFYPSGRSFLQFAKQCLGNIFSHKYLVFCNR